jgi:UDP-N-acetylmuramoylalanine--D-glutamate ligase
VRFSDLSGRKVAIWGHGTEGTAVAERCRELGVDFVVALPDEREADAAVLRGADVVVKSPGVPVTAPLYRELAAAGTTFTSLTDLWLSDHASTTIGVTGSKGKSTTASAIGHVLAASGRPADVLGNIGRHVLERSSDDRVTVLEVSSYQAQSISVSPRVAVVTSLFPEHVPWHGSVERYYADKLRIVELAPEHVVVPGDDDRVLALVGERLDPATQLHVTGPGTVHVDDQGDVVWAGVGAVPAAELQVRGAHNARNLALALLAADVWSPEPGQWEAMLAALASFAALEHRMEPIPSTDGRTWIDDGLATAPEAVIAALTAWESDDVALIFGGADRGLDLAPLAEHLATRERPVELLLIGPAGARFAEEYGAALAPHRGQAFGSLVDAVRWATSDENPAAVVLLSPGAPSFDEFADYRERSAVLRALVSAPTRRTPRPRRTPPG